MDTLTKLQTIRNFEKWAAEHKIDASPLALLEYLDQETKQPAAEQAQPTQPIKGIEKRPKDPHETTYTMPGAAGYTVFVIDGDEVLKMEINHFSIYRRTRTAHLIDNFINTTRVIDVHINAFGKTVFFTKPEAERALAQKTKKELAEVAKNCHTCKWKYAPLERVNCHNCRAYSLWEA